MKLHLKTLQYVRSIFLQDPKQNPLWVMNYLIRTKKINRYKFRRFVMRLLLQFGILLGIWGSLVIVITSRVN